MGLMKVTNLYFDSGVCPNCKRKDVMLEYEDKSKVERYCSSCDYSFSFKKRLMREC